MYWQKQFRFDAVSLLLKSGNQAIEYFTRRDLLQESVGPVENLWKLKDPQHLLKKLSASDHREYTGDDVRDRLIQTFKNLLSLVNKYALNCKHPEIADACEFIFSFQSIEGDIRGFIGNQYAPYYTGLVMALLVQAGFSDDPRVEQALRWLLSVRQNDGGWVIGSPGLLGIPHLNRNDLNYLTSDKNAETIQAFDSSQPFSHSGTGMVIRAFAVHPRYRTTPETLKAVSLLKTHFFKQDNYSSYRHPDNWIRFEFPFWWNNILAALDSLSIIGISPDDADVKTALDWFIANQKDDGLWNVSYSKIHKAPVNKNTAETRLWITLAVCKIFKRFFEHKFKT